MSSDLSNFADVLTPNNWQVKAYKSVLNDVVKILHKSPYRIGRIRAGGSFSKDTGIPNKMDLDITFFLNDFEPPFHECLTEIKDLITSHLDVENAKTTNHSIIFHVYCDDLDESLKVDLLPAPNFVVDTKDVDDICLEQQQRTLDTIRQSENPFKMSREYASSFTEASVEFMKSVSDDVRQLVRLAKFWKDSVYFDGYVPGLSSTIELIAVYAGIESTRYNYGFSMDAAFREFLTVMENIGTARIIFSHNEMDEEECLTFYDKDDIDESVWNQEPLVLDPVNPFNNRLQSKRSQEMFVDVLSQKARESLEAMNDADYYDDDIESTLLTVLCPGPFDSCFQYDISGVMETPEEMAMTTIRAPKIRESKITERGTVHNEEQKWAEFLLHLCDRIVYMAQEMDLDCVTVLEYFFENATKEEFRKLKRVPDYYQHTLRIPIGGGMVTNIFIRWKK